MENFCMIISLLVHIVSGIISITFTIYHRKNIQNLWNLINQLDDYIVRFLEIDLNYKRENMLHLTKILLLITANTVLGAIMSRSNFTSSVDFQRFSTVGKYFVILNQCNSHKCIFFLAIISNRLKVIVENFNEIKQNDHKIVALMQIYSILWKLSRKIAKVFYIPMILNLMCFHVNFIFFGHLLAIDVEKKIFNFVHFVTLFGPYLFIGFYCNHGELFQKIVSIDEKFTAIINTSIPQKSTLASVIFKDFIHESYNDALVLQIWHQKIEFDLKEICNCNYKLFVQTVSFSVMFHLVFIGFYVY